MMQARRLYVFALNNLVARGVSLFIKGIFGLVVHFTVMGFVYNGVRAGVRMALFPMAALAIPADPATAEGLVYLLDIVLWLALFVVQIAGVFVAAPYYRRSRGRIASQRGA